MTIKQILVPTDFSETSDHALEVACSLARSLGATLKLLHVVPDPAVVHPEIGLSMVPISEFKEEIDSAAQQKLSRVARSHTDAVGCQQTTSLQRLKPQPARRPRFPATSL